MNVDKNVWACQSASYMEGRGGRKGGNVLDFVAHMEGCSVRDAALNLNHWFNVQDDQDDLTTVATETAVRRPPSRKQGKKLAAKEKSPEGESEGENKVLGFELKGIDSSHADLKTRGIKPETADHFGVGFFPGKGSMKGRVVFPIRNPAGELVGYAGRSIDDSEPRYKVPGGLKKSLLLWGLDSAVASVVPLTVLDNGVGFGGALDFGEDILCRSCPDKGLGRLVARFQVLVDGGLEFGNTAEHAAADALLCQLAEPALDEIEPRRRRGNEVKVEAGVLREPLLHLLMLVRGVVVHDQMQLQRRWRFAVDLA